MKCYNDHIVLHLIAPGILKKNGMPKMELPKMDVPKGIANQIM